MIGMVSESGYLLARLLSNLVCYPYGDVKTSE